MSHVLTRESARADGSPYSDDQLAALIPPGGITPAQVAAMDIPADDRHRLLVYAMGADDATLRLHAGWCSARSLELARKEEDGSPPRECGKSRAPGPVRTAEIRSAQATRMVDARKAAEHASWAACGAASHPFTQKAAWDAAWNAEREFQVQDLASRLS